MDSTAIKQIQDSANIPEMLKHLEKVKTQVPVAFIPDNFTLKNIEHLQEYQSRYRMKYRTSSIKDFTQYGIEFTQDGAACFVDPINMAAGTIFDLGTIEKPLHREHTAGLQLSKTAAYRSVININEESFSQKSLCNFIEDWQDFIEIFDRNGGTMAIGNAVSSIRDMTIETARSINSQVDDFSQNMTAVEKIEATSKVAQPAIIVFTCEPFLHFESRKFQIRISVNTSSDRPSFSLRVVGLEAIQEGIAEEFKELLLLGFKKTDISVYMGEYQ